MSNIYNPNACDAEFFSDLCNAVYRGAHPEITDEFRHTSDVARATALRILKVLDEWGIEQPEG